MDYFDALYLMMPVLIGFLITMVLAAAMPSGFIKFPFNLVAILSSLWLICRSCTALHDSSFHTNTASRLNFEGIVVVDQVAAFACFFLGIAAFAFFTMAPRYLDRKGMHTGEFYLLALVSLCGMVLTVSTQHFTGLILGVETMTIPLYFMIAMDRKTNEGRLAALKYLILGGVGTSILVYGVALIFGATGSLNFPGVGADNKLLFEVTPLFIVGSVFLLGGFLFKTGAFPFQSWVPDVYGSAPTPVTGFMATAVKFTAMIALFKLFVPLVDSVWQIREFILPVVAVITMTVGNLMALRHNNPKMVLAYSSIAHTGYLLVGFCSGMQFGGGGVLYYLAVYVLMTLGAFAVLSSVPGDDPKLLQGAIRHRPLLAIFFTICILSLAGVPPFGGFIGKFFVFGGAWASGHGVLVGIAILNSLLALGYYIPLLRWILFEEPAQEEDQTSRSPYLYISCWALTLGVVVTGVNPSWLTDMIALVLPVWPS